MFSVLPNFGNGVDATWLELIDLCEGNLLLLVRTDGLFNKIAEES